MARTTINSQGVPVGTITASDLSYPLTDFSSTGIDDNASSNAITISSGQAVTMSGLTYPTSDGNADQVLKTNGSGTLSFVDVSSGGVEYVTKTTTYTASANEGVIANTSGGAWTLTLPASPSAGDKVFVADGDDWSTNNLTVARNGSTIEGSAADFVMDYGGVNVGFIYDGSTWQVYPQAGLLQLMGIDDNATSTALTIDSSGNVGIGETSPDSKLDITGQLRVDHTDQYAIRILNSNSTGGYIGVPSAGQLAFSAAGGGENIRIDSSGNVGIGTIDPQKKLEVTGDIQLDKNNANIWLKSGSTGTNGFINWTFNSDSTVYNKIGIDYDTRATTGFHIDAGYPITYTVPSNKAHQFVTGSSEAARIDGDGIKFNGDTAAANALDDYEEGTVTLSLSDQTNTISSWATAYYTKIGNKVTVWGTAYSKNISSLNSNALRITGLPFTTNSTYESNSLIKINSNYESNLWSNAYGQVEEFPAVMANMPANVNYALLFGRSAFSGANVLALNKTHYYSVTTASTWFTLIYRTS